MKEPEKIFTIALTQGQHELLKAMVATARNCSAWIVAAGMMRHEEMSEVANIVYNPAEGDLKTWDQAYQISRINTREKAIRMVQEAARNAPPFWPGEKSLNQLAEKLRTI